MLDSYVASNMSHCLLLKKNIYYFNTTCTNVYERVPCQFMGLTVMKCISNDNMLLKTLLAYQS